MGKRRLKYFLILAVIVFGLMQLYRPGKNIQKTATLDHFLIAEKAPASVVKIFDNSCNNCHSNYTNYYWHNSIAPGSWLVDSHVKEGKEHLNLSEWAYMDFRDQRVAISEMATNIIENKMPIKSYTLAHPQAKLTEEEKQEILEFLYTIEVTNN